MNRSRYSGGSKTGWHYGSIRKFHGMNLGSTCFLCQLICKIITSWRDIASFIIYMTLLIIIGYWQFLVLMWRRNIWDFYNCRCCGTIDPRNLVVYNASVICVLSTWLAENSSSPLPHTPTHYHYIYFFLQKKSVSFIISLLCPSNPYGLLKIFLP